MITAAMGIFILIAIVVSGNVAHGTAGRPRASRTFHRKLSAFLTGVHGLSAALPKWIPIAVSRKEHVITQNEYR